MLRRVIRGFTNVFGKPRNWAAQTDNECSDLHVRAVPDGEMAVFQSAWEPTPQELDLLNKGGSVILHCWGAQIPVALTVEPQEEPTHA